MRGLWTLAAVMIGVGLTPLGLDMAAPEQQRRVAFANWLIAADNPLTARPDRFANCSIKC